MDDREIALNKQRLKASSTQSSPIGSEEGQYDPFEKAQKMQLSAGDFDFESHEPHSRKPTEQTCYFWLTRRYFWPLYVPFLSQSDSSMYPTLIPKQGEEKEDLTTTSFIIKTSYNT